mmetsp:Transcript_2558/g.6403  ORF Transcript_2558/g.6403 Transcript_2558/m.6403 type:complete len:208 (-) Transcript_2558:322-945(-)
MRVEHLVDLPSKTIEATEWQRQILKHVEESHVGPRVCQHFTVSLVISITVGARGAAHSVSILAEEDAHDAVHRKFEEELLDVHLLALLSPPLQQFAHVLRLQCEDLAHIVLEIRFGENICSNFPLREPSVPIVRRSDAMLESEDPGSEPHVQHVELHVAFCARLGIILKIVLQEVLYASWIPHQKKTLLRFKSQPNHLAHRHTSAGV